MDQEILYRTGTIYRDVVDEESRTIEFLRELDADRARESEPE